MPIRAVIFDLFDTLVDLSMGSLPRTEHRGREFPSTMGRLHDAVSDHADLSFDDFAAVLIEVDREHRVSRHRKFREFPTTERFEILCERLDIADPKLPRILTNVHMGMIRSCASLPDHHPRILEGLRRQVPLAICSNFSDSATALRVLEDYGIASHLDVVVISEDVGFRKPDAAIFEVVLDRLGIEAADALHVGDNLEADVAGAGSAGLRTGWLTRRVESPGERLASYEGILPTYKFSDISEIAALVAGTP